MPDADPFVLSLPLTAHLDQIVDAFFRNQTVWLERLASGVCRPTADGRTVIRLTDCNAVITGGSGVLSLPRREPTATPEIAQIDQTLHSLRMVRARDALVWAPQPRLGLNVALLARGFDRGFEPDWMFRPLTDSATVPEIDGVSIRLATSEDIGQLVSSPSIPYVSENVIGGARHLHLQTRDRCVWWYVARAADEVVGQAIVHVTGDVAGLFNVAVHPRHRGRGIGAALTAIAIERARDAGATIMALNSTGDGKRLYQRAGFLPAGIGQTWFMPQHRMVYQVNPESVAIAEQIGHGDITAAQRAKIPSVLPNGDTPLQFAAAFAQRGTVHNLIAWGHPAEVIALWDVGLHDLALRAMQRTSERNRPSGPSRATPLHHAIHRNDVQLVQHLLAAGADLTRRDAQWHATPLGWAQHLGREDLADLIRQSGGR